MKTELLAWLINATFATTFACVAVTLLRKPLQRLLGAEIAYRLWIAAPLAAIAACFSLPHHEAVSVVATTPAAGTDTTTSLGVRVTHALSGIAADRWLLAVWLIGVGVLACVFAWQQRRYVVRLGLRRAHDGSWRSGKPDASPAVLGLLRQRLVLPESFESAYSHEERQLVIAHERMHQQRCDPWALATCALLRTLFWFNPIVHIAASLFRRDVELACDAAVLRVHPHSRRRYAGALFKAEIADGALPVGCQWHLTPPMKERIMLLKQALPSRRARWLGMVVVAVAAGGTTCVALAAHEAAMGAATALVTSTDSQSTYLVKLDMSVDGKPAAQPHLYVRPGDEAVVRIDDQGRPWGVRFHVVPAADPQSKAVRIDADVFTHDEKHVIGHPNLGLTAGTPGVIELNDPHATTTRPVYRIVATVMPVSTPLTAMATPEATLPPNPPAPPAPLTAPVPPTPPSMTAPTPPPAPPAPGVLTEQRRIVLATPEAAPLPPLPPLPPATPRVRERIMLRRPGPQQGLTPLPPLPPSPDGRRISISVRGPAGSEAPTAPPADESDDADRLAPPAPSGH